VQTILDQANWTDHCITPDGLDRLQAALLAAGHASALALPGLKPDRAPVIAAGFAILAGVFRSLHIEEMVASDGALREGALYDMLGRQAAHDVRETTIERLRERYAVDALQASRVERAAMALGEQAREAWDLSGEDLLHLRWAARIHEIGQMMSYAGHHRHGAYIVANSNLPGFSRGAQAFLAALVLTHRRTIVPERVTALAGGQTRRALRLAVLLRVAAVVNRTRSPSPRPKIKVKATGDRVHLVFPSGWLAERPLTRADLEEEAAFLAPVGLVLSWA
jgi:exopolyphosphatase/guanosine-5'-triphosphate,3'-diphosphate pyrophosphatase